MVLETGISVPILVGAALVDSINPCAIGVLVFLLAYLAKTAGTPHKLLVHGLVYISAVFITYFFAGLVLLPVIRQLGAFSTTAYIVIAALIILAGLIEIKDFFWYGKGFSLAIRPSDAQRIRLYVRHISDRLSTAFGLGVFVALVELPCTGAMYLAVLTLMSLSGVTLNNISFLVIYNLLFILPLVIIVWLMYRGVSSKKLHDWREKHKKLMRLVTGIALIALGLWMILFVV